MSESSHSELEDLEKVIIHLLSNQGVFYASLISQMRRTVDNTLPAPAGVTIRNGRIELHWNSNMMKEFTLKEKVAILIHECHHLIMDHLTRIQSRDPKMWNIATDLAINQMIQDLPKGVITLKSFPPDWKLKPKGIAEIYYDQIRDHAPRMKFTEIKGNKCSKCGGTGKDPDQSGQGKDQNKKGQDKDQQQSGKGQKKNQGKQGQGQDQGDGQQGQGQQGEGQDGEGQDQGDGQGQGQNGKDGKPCPECGGSGGSGSKYKVEVFDKNGNKTNEFELENPGTHENWDKGDSSDIAREVVRQTVEQAQETTQRQKGTVPGELQEYINELLKPPVIPWWVLLKRFIAAKIKSGFKRSWKRPNRRFGEDQKGKLPARKLKIVNVIDTSGSISESDFQDFIAEIQGIQRIYKAKMTNIECDWDIQKVYEMGPTDKVDTKFAGRGGTSFQPPFQYIEENHLSPDLVIYFTDLCGDFPDKKPPYPVLWVTVSDYEEAPFGAVLSIPKHRPKEYLKHN